MAQAAAREERAFNFASQGKPIPPYIAQGTTPHSCRLVPLSDRQAKGTVIGFICMRDSCGKLYSPNQREVGPNVEAGLKRARSSNYTRIRAAAELYVTVVAQSVAESMKEAS